MNNEYTLANRRLNSVHLPSVDLNFPLDVISLRREFIPNNEHYLHGLHMHSFFEVHIFLEGEQTYHIGEEYITCCPGDVLCISPYVYHSIPARTENVEKYSINFTISKDELDSKNFFLDKIKRQQYFFATDTQRIADTFELILREAVAGQSGWVETASLLLITVLRKLSRLTAPHEEVPEEIELVRESERRIRQLERYIRDNVSSAITCNSAAAYLHISEKQLNRDVLRERGVNLKTFINKIRFERACVLLREPEIPIATIGREVGFENESSFTRFFNKNAGVSPGTYRQNS